MLCAHSWPRLCFDTTEISRILIFSISKQLCGYNWAYKPPGENPYFIGKIRVRVCKIECTLTTDNWLICHRWSLQVLRTGSEKNWSLLSPVNALAARRPQQRKRWRPQGRRCPMDPPIYGADSLAVTKRLPGIYCNSEPSKYENVLVLWGSCSRPWWSRNADNSFGWAQMELIVTGYRSM